MFLPQTYIDDVPNRVANVIIVTSVGTGIALLFMGARILVKMRLTRLGLTLDDWLLFAAMLTSLAMTALAIAMIPFGLGFHALDLEPDIPMFETYFKMWYAIQLVYANGPTFIKAAILILLLRVFPELKKYVLVTLVIIVLLSIACTVALIFQCVPISMLWSLKAAPEHYVCIDHQAVYYVHSVGNIISDFVMYLLPMRTFYNLHLHKSQRIGLLLIFGVGGLVVGAGIMRMAIFVRIFTNHSESMDPFWFDVPAILWSSLELNVGVICACLTCMKPLIDRIFGNTVKSPDTMYCYDDSESLSFDMGPISKERPHSPFVF